jgi:UDP-N-acetylmuramyl pentapeptide phosphotransferase/UDP-N-acetylglucosamine-1-phosphate transferase
VVDRETRVGASEGRYRERQIEFPREQMHHPLVTPVMIGISILCVIIVVIIVATDKNGPFIGPWG